MRNRQVPNRVDSTMNLFGRVIMAFMPITPRAIVRFFSRRYVAGIDLQHAIEVMHGMASENTSFTVDVLGEDIESIEETERFVTEYQRLINAISESGVDAHVSLKPTAFGLNIDYEQALSKVSDLAELARKHDIFVRLDMEDSNHTDPTLRMIEDLHDRGYKNTGAVLQGRLYRTLQDLERLSASLGPDADVRICKGIYLEPSDIAHTGYREIVQATSDAIEKALYLGMYVGVASHDRPVIDSATRPLHGMGMTPHGKDPRKPAPTKRSGKGNGYEFQFLLGVRGDVRRRLASEGHLTRVYIPYGKQWYEYSMRRLRENPGVAWHVAKSVLFPWTNRR